MYLLFSPQNDLKMSDILLSYGADPKYGRNLIGQNTLHLMALNSTDCDWSKQLAAMQKKVFEISAIIQCWL